MDSVMQCKESLHGFISQQQKVSSRDPEFESFEKKVEEIGQIIADMKSGDKLVSQNALKKANKWLGTQYDGENLVDKENGQRSQEADDNDRSNDNGRSNENDRSNDNDRDDDNLEMKVRVKTNRSVINQKAFDRFYEKKEETKNNHMSPEEFMKQVETDAKERTEQRIERQKIADKYRAIGQKAYENKEYEKALVEYDKAIEEVRDQPILYTSRAQTLLRLGLYDQVLPDSDKALQLDKDNLYAHLYKAHAMHCMGDENEAEEYIEELKAKYPNSVNIIDNYAAHFEEDFEELS
uniref:Tetratricopeptide repeat protein 12 n=1 Tax=Cacopsylla melanoneura TaxID=428564 RepID=A0A8D9B711_9HEMI